MTEPGYPYPPQPDYMPPYYMRFSFTLMIPAQTLDPEYENQRAKNLVERMLGRDNVWDWKIDEVHEYPHQPVNP